MNIVLIVFFCAAIFLPTVVHGLECYQCTLCSQPFSTYNATIVSSNTTGESCYKITALSIAASKGIMTSCVEAHIGSIGTWCCNTDLCNAAQSIMAMNLKMLISALLLIIGGMKML